LFEEPARDYDRSKWLFLTRGISGEEVERRLAQNYQIQCELSGVNYVLAMTGMGTTSEDLERLIQGIDGINESIAKDPSRKQQKTTIIAEAQGKPRIQDFGKALITAMPLWEAMYTKETTKTPLKAALGKVAGEFIIPYPPGIPVLLPGSRISQEMIDYIDDLLDKGISVVGVDKNREILLIKKETGSYE
jgi:arginine/lysine/ornithine decarboxylase